jgi:hypothetical protein
MAFARPVPRYVAPLLLIQFTSILRLQVWGLVLLEQKRPVESGEQRTEYYLYSSTNSVNMVTSESADPGFIFLVTSCTV